MMIKRVFWLALAALTGWLIWWLLRQRQQEFATTTPQFRPPQAFDLPAPRGSELGAAPAAPIRATEPPEQASPAAADSADIAGGIRATTEPQSAPAADRTNVEDYPPIAAAGALTTANENERATAEDSNVALPEDARALDEQVVGYCVRCKTKRPIKDAHEEKTESGRRAARGTCPVCGANMFTFLATNDEEPAANNRS
jgi:hypothetical protein